MFQWKKFFMFNWREVWDKDGMWSGRQSVGGELDWITGCLSDTQTLNYSHPYYIWPLYTCQSTLPALYKSIPFYMKCISHPTLLYAHVVHMAGIVLEGFFRLKFVTFSMFFIIRPAKVYYGIGDINCARGTWGLDRLPWWGAIGHLESGLFHWIWNNQTGVINILITHCLYDRVGSS